MIPKHFFVSSIDGSLHDTRIEQWYKKAPLREVYKRTFGRIHNTTELKATLRAGMYAWPGGYPMFFITSDGARLSFSTVRDNLREVITAIKDTRYTCMEGWKVVACDINYEGPLYDDQTGELIESAYGDDEE